MMLESASNPFATKFIRAGRLAYTFPADTSIDVLHQRLCASRWCGQILGPHGTGKTTLLRTMDAYWTKWGRVPVVFSLRKGDRRLPQREVPWRADVQVIVDGYEQLCFRQRLYLRWRCRARNCGLLVTTHRRLLSPTIWQTHADVPTAIMIVEQLTKHVPGPSEAEIAACFSRAAGNMRETLMQLYDLHPSQRGPDNNQYVAT